MNSGSEQNEDLALSTPGDSGTTSTKNKMRNFSSEPYQMNVPGRKRGLALIFSHAEFLTREQPREAPQVDNDRLKSLLKSFGFEVKLCQDYKKKQILNELLEVSKMDHSNYECLAIFVMTHGSPGKLNAHDGNYNVSSLWSYFTKTKCPTLRGKPKLFFIQACRGDGTDAGSIIKSRSDYYKQASPSFSYSVPDTNPFHTSWYNSVDTEEYETPDEPDFLVAYATIPGHYAYRNTETGSWFIQEFCHTLEECGRKYDLLTLLTFIAQQIAIDRQTYSDFICLRDKKQIPSIVHTLERPLYFFPAKIEKVPENLQWKSLVDKHDK